MNIINKDGKPIKSWCEDADLLTMEQAENLSKLPFIFSHVALMPDAHVGYGMPIGGVVACEANVIPNAVGVDIGCGMLAVRTGLSGIGKQELKEILSILHKTVPVGFSHRKERQTIPELTGDLPVCGREYQSAQYQLGTLGGGNHFIEIQKGDDGHVWYMIHSGSRNLGKQVADHYNKLASELNIKGPHEVPSSWQLAYLEQGSDEFNRYISEMEYCLTFARANRDRMSHAIMSAFNEVFEGVSFDNPIDIHHNYAAFEEHDGRMVWVHRKGATSAEKGVTGIIPGSQGSSSYIVTGKGSNESFRSCSHGAGRKIGRKQAMQRLDLNDEIYKLEKDGILHSLRNVKDLDEAPGAYKDIDAVMSQQTDLVDISVKLRPLAVFKG